MLTVFELGMGVGKMLDRVRSVSARCGLGCFRLESVAAVCRWRLDGLCRGESVSR